LISESLVELFEYTNTTLPPLQYLPRTWCHRQLSTDTPPQHTLSKLLELLALCRLRPVSQSPNFSKLHSD